MTWIKQKPGIGFLAIGLCGALLVLYSTVWGAGLISDSFQYIASARSLAAQRTLSYPVDDDVMMPLTQYPPAFPALLSLIELLGIDSQSGVRYLNAGIFVLNIVLVGMSARKAGALPEAAFFVVLLSALSSVLIEVHAWALSEPLYLCFALSSMLFLADYVEHRKRSLLLLAAGLFGMACLTRYVGLSLVAAGVVFLVIESLRQAVSWEKLRSVFVDISLLLGISCAPLATWTIRSAVLTGTLNNRSFSFVPLSPKNILSALDTLLAWFLPPQIVAENEKLLVLVCLALLCVSVGLIYFHQRRNSSQLVDIRPLFRLNAIYAFFYVVTLSAAKIFFDHNIGFSDRLLSPVLISSLVLIVVLLSQGWKLLFAPYRWLVGCICVYLFFYFSAGAFVNVPRLHERGLGIARKSWQQSNVIQYLQTFRSDNADQKMSIYSNSPATVYLWTGRPGYGLAQYEYYVENLALSKNQSNGALVIFHHIPDNARIQRLTGSLPVYLVDENVATIYMLPIEATDE